MALIRPYRPTVNRSFEIASALAGGWVLGEQDVFVHEVDRSDGANVPNIIGLDSTIFARPLDNSPRLLDFTGASTSDRINLGTVPLTHPLQGGSRFCIFCKVFYRDPGVGKFLRIIDKSTAGSGADGWALWYASSAEIFTFQVNGGDFVSSGAFSRSTPQTIILMLVVGNGVANFYINGALSGTANQTLITSFPAVACSAAIGNWNHATDRMWLGSMDFVLVSLTAPSPDEAIFLTTPGNEYSIFDPSPGFPFGAFADVGGAAAFDLDMASLLHTHALDALSLSSSSALSIQSLLHTHALDALSLTESSALAIRDLLHGHTLDAVNLNQASVLAIQDLLHSHTIDGVTLAQIANTALAIADLLHGHTLDSADLSVTAGITIQSLLHTHALDSVDLSTVSVLSIDSLLHTHLLDTLSLSPAVTMAIQSLLHSHGIEAITLTVVETDIGVGERLILVQADGRTVLIQADGRTITIQ